MDPNVISEYIDAINAADVVEEIEYGEHWFMVDGNEDIIFVTSDGQECLLAFDAQSYLVTNDEEAIA